MAARIHFEAYVEALRFCSGGDVHPRQVLKTRVKAKMEEVKGRVSVAGPACLGYLKGATLR